MKEYELENTIMYGIVIFMVTIAFIFIGVCILIFSLSLSRTGKFLKQPSQDSFRRAHGFHVASIVFTVFIILFVLSGVEGFFTCLADVWYENDPAQRIWDIVEIVEFLAAVTAFVLGVRALTSYGKAKALYNRMFPPRVPYYPQQVYPQQFSPQQQYPQQGYPQQFGTQQQYPQQTATQQTAYSTAAPAEKMCPSCGVVNDGKNQFCIFCGKAL